eukprot:685542-Prymnesium_polylepis.1
MVSSGLGTWQVLRAQSCQTRQAPREAMQGGGGLRRAAPCASRVGTGRGRVAGGRFGRGAAESRAAWDRP